MHNSTTAEVGVSLKHIILPLWYSLVCNFSLCGHLSPVSLGNSFSDTSNSYLNGLWRVPRKERVIQSRFMSSQETNSPQCHTVLPGSAGGCGNGTSCRIWLETLEPSLTCTTKPNTSMSEALGCWPVILVTSEHSQINDGLIQKSLCLWVENN